jgi:hypothetical protein
VDYNDGDKRSVKISTAKSMVMLINSCQPNSVASLDIFCHGTPYSLNFSVNENENCGLVTGWVAKQGLRAFYSSFEDGVYNFSSDSRYVSDIDFNVFSEDARVQIHGCNTARGSMPGNTLVQELSELLLNAGKKLSYVIGHTDKSNPNINGGKTTIRQQDYRHGERAVFHGGEQILLTKEKGFIKHDYILGLIR